MRSRRELIDRYGGNRRDAVNRAIRAELVGGDDCLDALNLVDRLARRLTDRGLAGGDEAQEALDSLRSVRAIMERIIHDRYARGV